MEKMEKKRATGPEVPLKELTKGPVLSAQQQETLERTELVGRVERVDLMRRSIDARIPIAKDTDPKKLADVDTDWYMLKGDIDAIHADWNAYAEKLNAYIADQESVPARELIAMIDDFERKYSKYELLKWEG